MNQFSILFVQHHLLYVFEKECKQVFVYCKHMLSKKFLDVLDAEQKRKDFLYPDLLNIMKLCEHHFNEQKLGDKSFTGFDAKPSPSLLFPQLQFQQQPPDDFASFFDKSLLSNSLFPKTPFSNEIAKPIAPVIKKTKRALIETDVQTISDLLNVIDENEYHADTEYNIDLEALCKIKGELTDLDTMVGLSDFKKQILNQILYFTQNLHVGVNSDFMHTVLSGPPGTGKTEIATILGKMYSKIGILKKNVFKKVTRSDLVAGYLGQTAIKTSKVIEECLGGCLFIDEAYALGNDHKEDSFSKECIDTLCEALSSHKGELMVIVAGYKDELASSFFKANRGLESRFIWRYHLDEYSHEDMRDIFVKKTAQNDWFIDIERPVLTKWFNKHHDKFKHFGRDVELLFSYVKVSHGRRLYGNASVNRKHIDLIDLNSGFDKFESHTTLKPDKEPEIFGLYV